MDSEKLAWALIIQVLTIVIIPLLVYIFLERSNVLKEVANRLNDLQISQAEHNAEATAAFEKLDHTIKRVDNLEMSLNLLWRRTSVGKGD